MPFGRRAPEGWDEFHKALEALGFRLVEEGRRGWRYAMRLNPYLVYFVHLTRSGEALFSWEFSLGDYLRSRGLATSADPDSLLLFPPADARGRPDAAWVMAEMERAEAILGGLDLLRP